MHPQSYVSLVKLLKAEHWEQQTPIVSIQSTPGSPPDIIALVTIKAAVLQRVLQQAAVGAEGRSEDKHA